jgi:hypothetical protein
MRRLPPQTLAAAAMLALLAIVAVITAPSNAPVGASFASTDYAGGGYRAWTELLDREGVRTARFVLRPIELDARIDTLISAQPIPARTNPAARTAADLAAMATWVRAGGHLVYIGRNAALSQAETAILDLPYFLPDVGPRGALRGDLARAVRSLDGLGSDRMLLVEHRGRVELADGNGDLVVRYSLGRGDVVAVVDPVPFTNARIAHAANARLAYLLAVPHARGGSVAFDDGVHGALIDRPWYRALPTPVRVTLAIAAIAALLALVGNVLRTGPAIALRRPREPTSAEFVDALAALHERIRARAVAAGVLERHALAIVAREVGLSDRAAPVEILARVGERPGATAVRRLVQLPATAVATDAELIASAQLARTVGKEWTHGGNGDGRRATFAGWSRTRRRW